jgi:hypothetical protein
LANETLNEAWEVHVCRAHIVVSFHPNWFVSLSQIAVKVTEYATSCWMKHAGRDGERLTLVVEMKEG